VRRGTTLLELVVILGIIGTLAGIAFVPAARTLDRIRVRDATASFSAACALARQAAISRSAVVTVHVDTQPARLTVVAGADTIHRDHLAGRLGVTLSVSGASVAYSPTGQGWGLSNMRFIARRGAAGDTATVSRLGRVRR
jgi:Tfp pilus assembly protein FimT